MLSRRQFVMSPLAAGTTFAAGASLAQVNKRTIVDAQMHLWKAESEDWKWPSGMQPQLPEPFTIERLLPLMNEAGVDRAIIVPPAWVGDRNDYALEAARRYPDRFAAMGRISQKKPGSGIAAIQMARASGHARSASASAIPSMNCPFSQRGLALLQRLNWT